METIYYILLAIVSFSLIKSIFFPADRTPIPETSGRVYKAATAAELRAVLASSACVVVDFYADWCPPCRAIAPVFSGLADAHADAVDGGSGGRLAFAKVNVDRVPGVAAYFEVTAMPTFVVFRGGAPAGVAVAGLAARPSVVRDGDGLVTRVRGADKVALEAVVRALAAEVGSAGEVPEPSGVVVAEKE
ncbi:putative thioredoxin [Rosellinia necatrix]|uniref:Putative thioredoxin n=1 Tax=Rosellinia necatrix TaxID=77044 RepID=A0A1S8A4Q4_ROSNE|nr:putative thioredoxin [Rosellinia necatrix]